jgi:hypothetical protein
MKDNGRYFEAIDVTDHLMIRGLGSLVRPGMLERFDEFLEHSGMALWVAKEASLEIVKRVLRADGLQNPSAKDAGRFLDDAFGSAYESDGYFDDFFDDRIKTVHRADTELIPAPAFPLTTCGICGLTSSTFMIS